MNAIKIDAIDIIIMIVHLVLASIIFGTMAMYPCQDPNAVSVLTLSILACSFFVSACSLIYKVWK